MLLGFVGGAWFARLERQEWQGWCARRLARAVHGYAADAFPAVVHELGGVAWCRACGREAFLGSWAHGCPNARCPWPRVRQGDSARVSRATPVARDERENLRGDPCASGCAKGTQSVTQTGGAPVAQTDEGPGVLQHPPGLESDTQNEREKRRS